MVFLITYDLNKSGKNYDGVYEAIKSAGTYWWHYLDSTWIIKSSSTVSQISDDIKKEMDGDDNLLVIEVNKNYAGWLSKKAWESLKEVFN